MFTLLKKQNEKNQCRETLIAAQKELRILYNSSHELLAAVREGNITKEEALIKLDEFYYARLPLRKVVIEMKNILKLRKKEFTKV